MKPQLYLISAIFCMIIAATGSATAKSKNWAIGPMYQGTGKVSSIHPEPLKPRMRGFRSPKEISGWKALKGNKNRFDFKGFRN